MKRYDSVVIGGGPAGITAALYLARLGASVALLEKAALGGLLLQTAHIENYPGFLKVAGYTLADALEEQLRDCPVDRVRAEARALEHVPGGCLVRTDEGDMQGSTIIICSGRTYSRLGLPEEEKLTGRGVSYCAICDGPFFKDRVVAVVGGGNTALEESLYLAGLAKEVHLTHRRDTFRADRVYQRKVLATPNIIVHYNTVISALHGGDTLEAVTLSDVNGVDGAGHKELPVEGLFVFIGQSPVAGFLPDGLRVDEAGFIITDTEMRTSIPGIFAAGDARSKLCRQVVTSAGDGATAARSAYLFLEKA